MVPVVGQVDQQALLQLLRRVHGRIRWTKPKLGILEAVGSPQKENNCVLVGGTELSLLYDPLDPDPRGATRSCDA